MKCRRTTINSIIINKIVDICMPYLFYIKPVYRHFIISFFFPEVIKKLSTRNFPKIHQLDKKMPLGVHLIEIKLIIESLLTDRQNQSSSYYFSRRMIINRLS